MNITPFCPTAGDIFKIEYIVKRKYYVGSIKISSN